MEKIGQIIQWNTIVLLIKVDIFTSQRRKWNIGKQNKTIGKVKRQKKIKEKWKRQATNHLWKWNKSLECSCVESNNYGYFIFAKILDKYNVHKFNKK